MLLNTILLQRLIKFKLFDVISVNKIKINFVQNVLNALNLPF